MLHSNCSELPMMIPKMVFRRSEPHFLCLNAIFLLKVHVNLESLLSGLVCLTSIFDLTYQKLPAKMPQMHIYTESLYHENVKRVQQTVTSFYI